MPLTKQQQVMAGNDRLADRALGRVAKRYRSETIGPMVTRIKKAKSLDGLLQQLGVPLLREMKNDATIEALTDLQVQAGLIGRVTAEPRVRKGKADGV